MVLETPGATSAFTQNMQISYGQIVMTFAEQIQIKKDMNPFDCAQLLLSPQAPGFYTNTKVLSLLSNKHLV